MRIPFRQSEMGELTNLRSKQGYVILQPPKTDKFIKGPGWWEKGKV